MTKPVMKFSLAGGFAAIAFFVASAVAATAGVTATTMVAAAVTAADAQAQSSSRFSRPVRTRPTCTSRLRCTIIQPHGARRCWYQRICTR